MRLFLGLLPFLLLAETSAVSLFDGESPAGWRAPLSPGFPATCWQIDSGTLKPIGGDRMLDLWSAATYRNFRLDFEFKLEPGANGGIKYLVQNGGAWRQHRGKWMDTTPDAKLAPGDLYAEGTGGLEFQIIDDSAREARDPKRRSGAMYSLIAPTDPPAIGPGVFHTGRIVVRGNQIEHYLNGRRVLQATLGSLEMEAAWDACKRKDIQGLRSLKQRETPIAITHHGTAVWYRNIRIQVLEP